MIYVFDTSSFIVLGHYFPSQFPSFWRLFDQSVREGKIISVKEVLRELDHKNARDHVQEWIKENKKLFLAPSQEESAFLRKIFSVKHFQQMISEKNRLQGRAVADPFVISAAKARNGYVVSEESRKRNSARIPNVCDHFGVKCTNLEGFLRRKKWQF